LVSSPTIKKMKLGNWRRPEPMDCACRSFVEGNLGFGIWNLGFGIWNLEFGI
jgi:hypothetical protein